MKIIKNLDSRETLTVIQQVNNQIKKICSCLGFNEYSLELIVGGHTNAVKVVVKADASVYFVKFGEKVAKEKEVYKMAQFNNNPLFLTPVEHSCLANDVLVLPFYEGICLDEYIFCQHNSNEQVFFMIEKVLESVSKKLWLIRTESSKLEQMISVDRYLHDHFDPLYQEVKVESHGKVYTFKELVESRVVYVKGGRHINLPSINEMIDDVLGLIHSHSSPYFGCVTGDFQPANVIIQNVDFKIVDLSNGSTVGDPALDVGKFFNFLNRFYRVSLLRDKKIENNYKRKLKVDFFEQRLAVNFTGEVNNFFENMSNNLEEKFSQYYALQTKDYYFSDRIKLFKFVVNIITLRRHVVSEELVDLLFLNIVDSYLEIMNKVKSI